MSIFDKIKEPVFLKETSSAVQQLEALKILHQSAPEELRPKIEQEIKITEAGIYGENQILFELKNSHMPMVVLHDLFFEAEGYTAQIDYLIITRRRNFVIECKNLFGNIEIDNTGAFTRTLNYGKMYRQEGIYSPITQNQRHLEVIKRIRAKGMGNWFAKVFFEKNFEENYRSLVVLANPKTVLNAKYAKKEIKNQVIRGDQLISVIKEINAEEGAASKSEKDMMELAQFFARAAAENPVDYLEKYRVQFQQAEELSAVEESAEELHGELRTEPEKEAVSDPADEVVVCPRCGAPMVRRMAAKGQNAGKEFWGCSTFPKCRGVVNIETRHDNI